jgi:hypothetical protein
MRTVIFFAALTMMVRLSGQGTEDFLPASSGSCVDVIVFTYYRQIIPDLESVTYLSNDKVLYATFFNGLNDGALRNLISYVKSNAELLFRIAFRKKSVSNMDEEEIIIPVKLADGRSLYLFPEYRMIIDYNGKSHIFPRIRPILITESKVSVWLRITS